MKKFKFNLENVRTERKMNENLRLREWSIVNRMMNELIAEKVGYEKRLVEAIQEMTEVAAKPRLSIGTLSEMEAFISGVKTRIDWKKGEISRAEKFVERKRLEWFAARQKRMVLDNLREKKLAEHKAAAKLRENREMDDLALMRARLRLEGAEDERS